MAAGRRRIIRPIVVAAAAVPTTVTTTTATADIFNLVQTGHLVHVGDDNDDDGRRNHKSKSMAKKNCQAMHLVASRSTTEGADLCLLWQLRSPERVLSYSHSHTHTKIVCFEIIEDTHKVMIRIDRGEDTHPYTHSYARSPCYHRVIIIGLVSLFVYVCSHILDLALPFIHSFMFVSIRHGHRHWQRRERNRWKDRDDDRHREKPGER